MAMEPDNVGAELRAQVQGIMSCLDQLEDEARAYGLNRAAALIGAASEALIDEEWERATKSSPGLKHFLN
jgi:hypothetical protein